MEEEASFVYLGSVVSIDRGSDEDVKVWINKARASHVISRRTKFKFFNTNLKAILLYGSETWRTTKQMTQKLQSFVANCLRRILKISWTNWITNEMLWERAGKEPIEIQILRRKWRWIGHTLRKPANSITRHTMLEPSGQEKGGSPEELLEKVGPHLEHARKGCSGQKPMEN